MNFLKSLAVAALALGVPFSSSYARGVRITTIMEPNAVYAPTGFDSNDNAQVVLDVTLTDSCQALGKTTLRHDENLKSITIEQTVEHDPTVLCAQVIRKMPAIVVELGTLDPGVYAVYVATSSGEKRLATQLNISQSTVSEADEHLYAPISQAWIKFDEDSKSPVLELTGTFTNSCMHLKDIEIISKAESVVEVLPIVEVHGKDCTVVSRPYAASLPLAGSAKGRGLLHVRSMSAQAFNLLVDFD